MNHHTHSREWWIIAVLAALLVCAGTGVAVSILLRRQAEEHAAIEQMRIEEEERQEAIARMETTLEGIRLLPADERARSTWRLWLQIVQEEWAHHRCCLELAMIDEFADIGQPAMEVMLESILTAPSIASNEAATHLWMFRPEATFRLAEIVETSRKPAVQYEALRALQSCTNSPETTPEERKAVRDAATPLLDHPDESLRQWVNILLKGLKD